LGELEIGKGVWEERGKNEEDAGVANGIAASGVQIQAHGRGAHQPLPPVEDQRPSFRGPGHPRSRRLQMGALGFAWYSFSPFFIFLFFLFWILYLFMCIFKFSSILVVLSLIGLLFFYESKMDHSPLPNTHIWQFLNAEDSFFFFFFLFFSFLTFF
jgi:hypothetical protein